MRRKRLDRLMRWMMSEERLDYFEALCGLGRCVAYYGYGLTRAFHVPLYKNKNKNKNDSLLEILQHGG